MDLSQLRTDQYAEFFKYIPSALTDAPSSVFVAFIESLSEDQAKTMKDVYDFKDNINVLTANTNGVTAWEAFLSLPDRPDLSLQARRGRLFSRMVVKAPTIQELKDVIRSYIGSDDFSINEYHTFAVAASAFMYEVQINLVDTTGFIQSDLEEDLIRIQPAHCRMVRIIDPFKYLTDTLTATDSVTSQVISVIRADISPSDSPDHIAS
jgi:hypothetical protein